MRARYGPLLSGTARFVADVRRPGQASARVVRSEQAHGRLLAVDRLGAKGVGDAGVVGVAAAVGNAVADAVGPAGDRLRSLPITAEKVWRLPHEADRGRNEEGQ